MQVDKHLIDDSSAYFKCGCGAQFATSHHFKDHSLRLHEGKYVQNSTHFLSIFTQLVLPIAQQQENSPALEKQQYITNDDCTVFQEIEEIEPPTHTRSVMIHTKNQTNKRNTHAKSISKQENTKQKKKGKSAVICQMPANEDIEWNGFRLIKNHLCAASDTYFCGKCRISFDLPEQFIVHCIEVCQQLKNTHSSHFIKCIFDSNATQENNAKNASKNSKNEQNFTKKIESSLKISTSMMIAQDEQKQIRKKQLKPFLHIYWNKLDHKNIPFYCGFCCNHLSKCLNYLCHIKNCHSQLIHPSSSHIILRFQNINNSPKNMYLSPKVEWPYKDPIYFCPCKAEIKMPMEILIKHVMEVHKGISPFYINPNSILQLNAQIENTLKQVYRQTPKDKGIQRDPIYQILKYRSYDQPPFYCNACGQISSSAQLYAYHFYSKNAQHQLAVYSHVLFKANYHNRRRVFFISVKKEWGEKRPIYYCPCSFNIKMTMNELLQHHIQVHRWVSPDYTGQQFK